VTAFSGTDFNDVHGGVYAPSLRDSRSTRAIRRGLYRTTAGFTTNTGQAKLVEVAGALATAHGPFHPVVTTLPLNNIQVQRIGADLYEYQLEYSRNNSTTSKIDIRRWGGGAIAVPYANEADSGRRWNPNRHPGYYVAPVTQWLITKTRRFNSISNVNTALNTSPPAPAVGFNWVTSVNTVNNAQYTLATGLQFPTGTLKYVGTTIETDEDGNVSAGVQFSYLGIQYPSYDGAPSLVLAGHGIGSYTATNARPYWAPQWDTPPQVTFPNF